MAMTCTDRVITALNFEKPDYIPLHNEFWGITVQRWRERQGLLPRNNILPSDNVYDSDINTYYGIDLIVVRANDEFFPSQAHLLGQERGYFIKRDGWGRLTRSRQDGTVEQTLKVALVDKSNLDQLEFESPYADFRYEKFVGQLNQERARPGGGSCALPRIGGPFLRCSWLRGEQEFLIDIAEDPVFVSDLVGRVVDHRIAVGLEELRRGNLYETGIGIFDDIAHNRGLLISPRSYETLFLPHLARMVKEFKDNGAARILYHSDGDIRLLLDAFIDIGIDVIHPLEVRAGMDVVKLRKQYGDRLAFVGGLCNTLILPAGTNEDVRQHLLHVLSVGREGGLVIGSHSIGADISLERYDFVHSLLAEYGGRPNSGKFVS